jgi:hypothetical protein
MTDTIWRARYEDHTPARVTAVLRGAQAIISRMGYSPYGEQGSGLSEFSICAAIDAAARKICGGVIPGDLIAAADLAEEVTTRFAGWLYLVGQLSHRTSIHDISDSVTTWERTRFADYAKVGPRRYHTAEEACAFLEAAAVAIEALPATAARS